MPCDGKRVGRQGKARIAWAGEKLFSCTSRWGVYCGEAMTYATIQAGAVELEVRGVVYSECMPEGFLFRVYTDTIEVRGGSGQWAPLRNGELLDDAVAAIEGAH